MQKKRCRVCGDLLIEKGVSAGGFSYLYCPRCRRTETSLTEEEIANDLGWSNRKDIGWKIKRREKKLRPFVNRLNRWFQYMERQDPYQVLGVSSTDSFDRIRTKFKELANHYHPDRPEGNQERMREILSAYEKIKLHRSK